MKLPYATILKELKSGPKTLKELQELDKEGDTAESLICRVARGLVQALDNKFVRNEDAIRRDQDV